MVAHNFLVPTSDQKGCLEMKDLKGELEKKNHVAKIQEQTFGEITKHEKGCN